MKLTKELALQMIEEYRGKTKSDRWIDHCICVGDTAGKIAKALTEKGYNVDIDKTITLGYLHDIGKYTGESHGHEISGYNYLKGKGYDEGVPNPQDKPTIAEFVKTHKYTIEEKLINLCDLMCPQGGKVFTIDKRLIDIMIRRGAYSNTQYHIKETYRLKEYFDKLLGYNLYDLFPEIKDNL